MQKEASEWISSLILKSSFSKSLRIELVSAEEDAVHLRLPVGRSIAGVGNSIHGGVISSLADIAGTAAAIAGADVKNLAACSVSQLSITHLSFMEGAYAEATTRVVHRTDKQVLVDIMLKADGHPLAKATAICRLFERTNLSSAA